MNKIEAKIRMLKEIYPVGTRVVLEHMEDTQAPPPNTQGTIRAIDGIGTIHVEWDNGSHLGLIYGTDKFHKIE